MPAHSADTIESDNPAAPPSKIAVISDIHGNLPAFEAVMADVRETDAEEIWCLGDVVGYGAQPDECVTLAREVCHRALAGNHDLVVTGDIDIGDFSSAAAAAAAWTRENIAADALEWLRSLSPDDEDPAVALYHASPRDPVWEYVLSTWQAEECLPLMARRVGAVGHSHVALWFREEEGGNIAGSQAAADSEADLSEGRWLLNPGGVGQPRDGDPRAAWMLLDTDAWSATWRRVEYPIERAAKAIEEAGLPPVLGERLYTGQ
jgi:diadenosine tetraphosphatase ApaH/serine/threonine PP2A family protein phosphatase